MSSPHRTVRHALAAAAIVSGAVVAQANAFDLGSVTPTTPGTTIVLPSGATVTATATGATTISSPAEALSARGAVNANFSPQINATTVSLRPLVSAASCGTVSAGATKICSGLGTVTLTFSQPVRNPTLHIAGLGAALVSGSNAILFSAAGSIASTPAGATLGPALPGSTNLQTVGNDFRVINDSVNTSCATVGIAAATSGCGSFKVNGTVTSLRFTMNIRLMVKSGSLTVVSANADAFNLTVTIPQDQGDAPASYDGTQAPTHDISDLTLGATIDEDATTAANPTTAAAAVAAAGNPNPPNGDGADEDALTTWPTLTTAMAGSTYSVDVPVSGLSAAARLCGWIDFDRSGAFDAAEMACATAAPGASSATLTWNVPTATAAGRLYTRLRLSYNSAHAQAATGRADSGEVEDSMIAMMPTVTVEKTLVNGGSDTFNLAINGATKATAIGDGGTTGTQTLFHEAIFGTPAISVAADVAAAAIPLTLSESATTGNTYAYTSTSRCVDGTGATVLSGTGTTTSVSIPRSSGTNAQQQNITCTFTNTAKPAAVSVDKQAGAVTDVDGNGTDVGDRVTYTFVVTNTGGAPLTSVSVSDPKLAGASPAVTISCPTSALAIGASMTCTASGPYTMTQADVDAGAVTNTATATGTPPTGPAVTGTDLNTVPVASNPSISVDKTASSIRDLDGNGPDVGDTITYAFSVTNTGNVTLTAVAVTDPLLGTITCPTTTLAPGQTSACTPIVYTITAADVTARVRNNTATVSGRPPVGSAVANTDTTSTPIIPVPGIALDKSAGSINDLDSNGSDAGDTIQYSFTVTNTGTTTLASVAVSDPKVGTVTCPKTTLAAGESMTCTPVTYTILAADVTTGYVTNDASTTGTPPSGSPVTGTDSTTTSITPTPNISVDKQASAIDDVDANGPDPGDQITYTFVVTNTGGSNLSTIAVADAMLASATPSITITCTGGVLQPGESVTCTAPAYTLTTADLNRGRVDNSATASGKNGATTVEDTDTTSTPITRTPGITVDKTAGAVTDLDGNGQDAGDTITYGFTVTNTGNVTVTGVAVTDVLLGAVTCPDTSLDAGESMTCTPVDYTLVQGDVNTGSRTNTASVTGTPPSGANVSDTDSTITTITGTPSIAIDKTASAIADLDANGPDAGDTVTFGFTVTNTGTVTLTGVSVTDPTLGAVTCPKTTLLPGEVMTCTSLVSTLTQAVVNSGTLANTATAGGNSPTGAAVSDSDSTTTTIPSTPSVTIDKQASAIADLDANGPDAGDRITYTFVIKNTGNVTLSAATVTDPMFSAVTCPTTPLAPGASVSCAAVAHTLTQEEVDAGALTNMASVEMTPPTGQAVTNVDSTTTTIASSPAIAVDKQAGAVADLDGNGRDAGDTITYTFIVTNTGNVTLGAVGVSDAKIGTVTCPATSLTAGASMTCTAAAYTLTQADVDAGAVNNTAFAGGSSPTGTAVSASDSTSTAIASGPNLTLTKTASPVNDLDVNGHDVGDQVTYTFVVKNTGNVTLSAIALSDPLLGTVSCPRTSLAPGASMTCTAPVYALTQTDVDAGVRTNTATATATPPSGPAITRRATADVTLSQSTGLTIDKTASAILDVDVNGQDAGDRITYGFVVTNTGNVTLTGLAVSDPKLGTVTCPRATLLPGASMTCTSINYTLTQADVDAGTFDNYARVDATPPNAAGGAFFADDSTSNAISRMPALELTKTAGAITDVDGNGQDAGDTITYSFAIKNTGNVTLDPVTVSDPTAGTVTCPAGPLAPGATVLCSDAVYIITPANVDNGKVDNVATATGTPPSGANVTSMDDTSTAVNQVPAISVAKSVASIADPDTNGRDAGDTITYAFTVTNTGNVSLTGISVSDPLLGTVSCAATTLAAGASTSCSAADYVLTQPDVDSGERTNNVTVTGTSPAGVDVSASDSTTTTITPGPAMELSKSASAVNDLDGNGPDEGDTIDYTFTVLNTGTVTLSDVSVVDPLVGAVTCPATPVVPNASIVCGPVTYTLTQIDVNAGTRDNSATVQASPPLPALPITVTDTTSTAIPRTATITIDKTAGPIVDVDGNGIDAGDTISYGLTVTNTGNVTLTGVDITDPLLGTFTCPATELAPGAVMVCTPIVYPLSQTDVNDGVTASAATVTGTPPFGPDITARDATSTPVPAAPLMRVAKTASQVDDGDANGVDVGDTITYSFTVFNDGNVTLSNVELTDIILGTLTCPSSTIDPFSSMTCTPVTYTLAQSDVNGGLRMNSASATAAAPSGQPLASTAEVTRALSRTPQIALDKTASTLSDTDSNGADVGDSVTFSFTVTNTGNVSLSDIVLNDPMTGPLTCPAATLEPGEAMECSTATVTVKAADFDAGAVVNTATVSASTPFATTVTGSDATRTALPAAPVYVRLGLTSDRTTVRAGRRAGFTITGTNTGPTIARNVKICQVVPSDVSVVTMAGGMLSGGKICWTVDLKPGETFSRKVVYKVDRHRKSGRITVRGTLNGARVALTAQRPIRVLAVRAAPRTPIVTG